MNAEFQGLARRDKKAFLSYQCKEVEENNRMGRTSDLFKKFLHQAENKRKAMLKGENRTYRCIAFLKELPVSFWNIQEK